MCCVFVQKVQPFAESVTTQATSAPCDDEPSSADKKLVLHHLSLCYAVTDSLLHVMSLYVDQVLCKSTAEWGG